MKYVHRTMATLLMLACGAITSTLVAFVLGVIQAKLHFALYGFSFWVVIPVGAMVSGFVAAWGYRFGFFRYPYRPSPLIIGGVIAISIATYFAIHYFVFFLTYVSGRPISELISFSAYLNAVIQNSSIIGLGVGSLGALGYIPAITNIVGFAIGGFFLCSPFLSFPYCTSCERHLKTLNTSEAYSRFLSSLKEKFEESHSLLARGDKDGATHLVSTSGAKTLDSVFRLRLRFMQCPDCSSTYYDLAVAQINPSGNPTLHIRARLISPAEEESKAAAATGR
jgi:hypothetical protein